VTSPTFTPCGFVTDFGAEGLEWKSGESDGSFRDGPLAKGRYWAGWETLQAGSAELGWRLWSHRGDLITCRNFIPAEKKKGTHTHKKKNQTQDDSYK